MPLSQQQLLTAILNSIEGSGWNGIVVQAHKPFRLRIFKNESAGIDLCIYIWNCTHGGGKRRAPDEFRIQFTSVVPKIESQAITLLLGWHADYGVYAAWDIRHHAGQSSSSPSAQIKEHILSQAHSRQFAVGVRHNGETVVAFRPEFLVDYALNSRALHSNDFTDAEVESLNNLGEVEPEDIQELGDSERVKIIAVIARRYRASDFRRRVLDAYNHQCAMCGAQLNLIDASHIIPVSSNRSTDRTNNGVALCKNHHAAFDKNLISFDEKYRIEISSSQLRRLRTDDRTAGLAGFRAQLKETIALPRESKDAPRPELITLAREIRNWAL